VDGKTRRSMAWILLLCPSVVRHPAADDLSGLVPAAVDTLADLEGAEETRFGIVKLNEDK